MEGGKKPSEGGKELKQREGLEDCSELRLTLTEVSRTLILHSVLALSCCCC